MRIKLEKIMKDTVKTLAIITARGGSKRIPKKNIKDFLGKPIITYSIAAALESGAFDTVMVSTEDDEIARIAKKAGAAIPFLRSMDTANDYAVTADVIREVIETYLKEGIRFTHVCCIYPTAPFVTSARIREAMELLIASEMDCVIPVVPFSFPPQRGFIIENNSLSMKWPEYRDSRSQDLETFYHDCGQFYCIKTDCFLAQKKLYMEKAYPLVLKEIEVQDIDTLEDWELAEQKYQYLLKAKK